MNKAARLRVSLAEKPILKIMGAHNALGAKLIERHGFDGIWSSGFEIATAHGVPDANILTMTENLEAAQNIHGATQLPVICDCDTGYGNAINVMHMVRKYESAGMAAAVIEDKRFPKMNSFIPGRQELASIEEFVGKIEAAKSACSTSDGLLVFARVEALIAGWGMEEAVKRALAYAQAGADGIVIHSKAKTPDEVLTFAKIWSEKNPSHCPLIAIPTTYYSITSEELARAGFKIVIYANHGIRAAVKAMDHAFHEISTAGTSHPIEKDIVAMEEIFRLQGMPSYQEDEKRYSPEGEKIRAVIPAAADHQFQPELAQVLKGQPLCMLKIAGKSILEHQLDILRPLGVQEVDVIVGYKKNEVSAPDITKIENEDFASSGSAQSVMMGLEKLSGLGSDTGKTIVCYSDIIFDKHIPESLINFQRESNRNIILVIDRAYKTLPRRDKKPDLVSTYEDEESRPRNMFPAVLKKINKIGKNINGSESEYEFIGMFFVHRRGLNDMVRCWQEARWASEQSQTPFPGVASIREASMTDLFQFMITQQRATIYGLVIEHGWSEIYSLEDYLRLDRYFSEKKDPALLYTSA